MSSFLKYHLALAHAFEVKLSANMLLIRPTMEYVCAVWDLHSLTQTSILEKVQRHAAQWLLYNYNYLSIVFAMFKDFKWRLLMDRRKQFGLTIKLLMERLV